MNRVGSIPGNPSPYTSRMESITKVEAVDPLTVRIHTSVPNPYLPDNMVDLAIVSAKPSKGRVQVISVHSPRWMNTGLIGS